MNLGLDKPRGITIKSSRELDLMREAGKIIAEAKAAVKAAIAPGVTSKEMDALAEEIILKRGAIPSFKGLTEVLLSKGANVPAIIKFSSGLVIIISIL